MCLKSCKKDPQAPTQCLIYDRCSLTVHRGGGEREAVLSFGTQHVSVELGGVGIAGFR